MTGLSLIDAYSIDLHLRQLAQRAEDIIGTSAPAKLTLLASFFLSFLAIVTSGTLNRDGMLYVEAARAFQQGGLEAAVAVYYWPLLSILMAYVSQFSFLDIEQAGHLLNTLFMGGTGALIVACSQRMFPQACWAIGLAFLAIPGINDYRHEILREYGCWFFIMLGLWLCIRWRETSKPAWILASQSSILVAALFRPEALVFLIALFCWQLFTPASKTKWKNLLLIGLVPALGAGILFTAFLMQQLPLERLVYDISRLRFQGIHDKAKAMSEDWLLFAKPNALTILISGSLAIIPIKLAQTMGIMAIPLLTPIFRGESLRNLFGINGIFSWAGIVNLLILCIFVIDLQFLTGRYVAQWALFLVPITGYGLYLLWRDFPNGRRWIFALAFVLPLTNVINDPDAKKHFREAGAWLKANAHHYDNIYIEDGRTSYYAGLSPLTARRPEDRSANKTALIAGDYDLFALVQKSGSQPDTDWQDNRKFEQLAVFRDHKGESILIISARRSSGTNRHDS